MLSESTLCDRFQFTVLSLPMKNMVPFNSAAHSISQGYARACRGTTIKVGKMQLQTISNKYLSVESLAMIKGPVNSFLQERKVFLQRHQISLCHDKLPASPAKKAKGRKRMFWTLKVYEKNNNIRNSWPAWEHWLGLGRLVSLCRSGVSHTCLKWISGFSHPQQHISWNCANICLMQH